MKILGIIVSFPISVQNVFSYFLENSRKCSKIWSHLFHFRIKVNLELSMQRFYFDWSFQVITFFEFAPIRVKN